MSETTKSYEDVFAGTAPRTETGCVIWAGQKIRPGYAAWNDPEGRQRWLARELLSRHTPPPSGTVLRWRCGNISCVSLEHLYWGGKKETPSAERAGKSAKREILRKLLRSRDPLNQKQLIGGMPGHPTIVKQALDALVNAGRITRTTSKAGAWASLIYAPGPNLPEGLLVSELRKARDETVEYLDWLDQEIARLG